MRETYSLLDRRRQNPRVGVVTLCSEIVGGRERPGLAVDLSEVGLRIERPFVGGPIPRDVQLELEIPSVDEILWARGVVCFDEIKRARTPSGGVLRATGIRLTTAAARDLRVLREFVVESWRSYRPSAPAVP